MTEPPESDRYGERDTPAEAQEQTLKLGRGRISGYLSAGLGVLGVLGVLGQWNRGKGDA
jgi:hypothetical protein